MWEIRNAYKILVGMPEATRPLGRPSVDARIILKWILREVLEGVNGINLAQDRGQWQVLVSTVMKLRVP
jgi:hypothetical protein